MAEKIKELIRDYQEGQITRREFMRKAVTLTGSLAAANTLITTLMHSSSDAAQVDPHDPALVWHDVEYKGKAGPVFAHYGEKDPGVNQDIPGTEEAMKKYNKPYTYKIYPGAQHGFYNDTTHERYHPEAAKEAWGKTLDLFKKKLQG